MKSYNIAVIPGDGVGVEVTEATLDVLEAAASKFGFSLTPTHYEWGDVSITSSMVR